MTEYERLLVSEDGLISCDESGVHGSTHYGFGSLWMSCNAAETFGESLQKSRTNMTSSKNVNWSQASAKRYLPFYNDLISYFLERRGGFPTVWLCASRLWRRRLSSELDGGAPKTLHDASL